MLLPKFSLPVKFAITIVNWYLLNVNTWALVGFFRAFCEYNPHTLLFFFLELFFLLNRVFLCRNLVALANQVPEPLGSH